MLPPYFNTTRRLGFMRRSDMEKRYEVEHEFNKEMRERMNDPHLFLMRNHMTGRYEIWSTEFGTHFLTNVQTPDGGFREPSEIDIQKLQEMAWRHKQDFIRWAEEQDEKLAKKKVEEREKVRHELVKDYGKALEVVISGKDDINRSQILVNTDLKRGE
jgi:hypothetical protein